MAVIEPLSREDQEWYVRSAAVEITEQIQAAPPAISAKPPKFEDEPWLITWAVQHGVGLGIGEAAYRVLLQAMAEGDWPVKVAAADVLRVLGGPQAVPALRTMLGDDDALVREAAYAALCEISQRAGIHIPLERAASSLDG